MSIDMRLVWGTSSLGNKYRLQPVEKGNQSAADYSLKNTSTAHT